MDNQSLWQSKLLSTKPLLRTSLAFMWLFTALTSAFWFDKTQSFQWLSEVGVTAFWQPWFLYVASLIDALIGLALLANYKTKLNCCLQLAIMTLYTLIISIKLPSLWLDPFGSIVKNIPLAVSILLLYRLEPA